MCDKKEIFITLFPAYQDFHFYKDPGQIPYRFQKKYGFKSEIVCLDNNTEYVYTLKYIKVKLLKNQKEIVRYIVKNAKNIDILNVFHIAWGSLLYGFVYKIFHPKGFVYLKLDNCAYCGNYPWEKIFDSSIEPLHILKYPEETLKWKIKKTLIKMLFVRCVNLWSVEDEETAKYYSNSYKFFKDNLIVSYNGHTINLEKPIKLKSFSEKENIILTVGRLGTHPKATEILLEAFALIYNKNNWTLHLAGEIDDKFKPFIEKFYDKYPDLKSRIIFHGRLNKEELFDLYNRAKIFCLPSRYEGFAISFSEALYFMNAIITTPYVSPRNIIKDKMGLLVEKDDIDGLAKAMQYLIDNPQKMKEYGENAHRFAVKELNWDVIVKRINDNIQQRM